MIFNRFQTLVFIAGASIVLASAVGVAKSARSSERDAIRASEVRQVQAALEMYFAEKNSYPVAGAGVILGSANASCLGADGFGNNCASDRVYMPAVPGALAAPGYVYVSRTASGEICNEFPCAAYAIQFIQEKKRGLLSKGANCARYDATTSGRCR